MGQMTLARGIVIWLAVGLLAVAHVPVWPLRAPAQGARPSSAARLLGKPAPAFDLRQLDGGRLALPALRGKVVLLTFWTAG
jgi:hypothetical protein